MQVPFVCMWLMIVPTGTKRSPRVGTVLAHSLRRWISVVTALGGRISCFVVTASGGRISCFGCDDDGAIAR